MLPYPSVFVLLLCLLCIISVVRYWSRSRSRRSLSGLTVLITGCDHGLGYDTALALQGHGMRVFAGCLTQQGFDRLSDVSPDLIPLLLDVTDDRSVSAAVAVIEGRCPEGLYAVINNAGVFNTFLVEFTPIAVYQRVMEVNFLGTIRVCQQTAALVQKHQGRFLLIGSFLGTSSSWGLSAYSASKFALEAFHDSFRPEMSGFNVKVSLIQAGTMKTALVDHVTQLMRQRWTEGSTILQQKYGVEYLQILPQIDRLMNLMSQSTAAVIQTISSALAEDQPQSRYSVGWDSLLVTKILPHIPIPDLIMDFLALKLVGMPRPAVMKQQKGKDNTTVNNQYVENK